MRICCERAATPKLQTVSGGHGRMDQHPCPWTNRLWSTFGFGHTPRTCDICSRSTALGAAAAVYPRSSKKSPGLSASRLPRYVVREARDHVHVGVVASVLHRQRIPCLPQGGAAFSFVRFRLSDFKSDQKPSSEASRRRVFDSTAHLGPSARRFNPLLSESTMTQSWCQASVSKAKRSKSRTECR